MKRCMILGCLIGVFVSGIILFYQECIRLDDENKTLFKEFKKNQLVDVNGKINLVGVRTEYDTLKNEIKALFKQDTVEIEKFKKQIDDKKSNNVELKNKMESLSKEMSSLESKNKDLTNQYNVLKNKYNQLRNSLSVNNGSISNPYGFPLINQYPTYPTGCESVALTMLLRYYGINVSPSDVINKLKKEALPYYENGIKYGGNPEVGFVGNPYSSSSYGVYEKPIAAVANTYKSGIQIRSNFSFNEVLNLVANNHPVMVWTSMGLSVPYISTSWIYKPTGETISWKAGEHAVVLLSYHGDTVIIAAPIGGKLKNYSKSVFEQRYNYFGRKALFYL